jgi:hypothetical protein
MDSLHLRYAQPLRLDLGERIASAVAARHAA